MVWSSTILDSVGHAARHGRMRRLRMPHHVKVPATRGQHEPARRADGDVTCHTQTTTFFCVSPRTTPRPRQRQARVANWETRRSLENIVCSSNRPRGWLAGCHPSHPSHLTLSASVFCILYCTHTVHSNSVKGPENIPRHPWESASLGLGVEWPPAGMEQSPK